MAIIDALPFMGETPTEKITNVYSKIEKLLALDIMKKSNDLWKLILVGEDAKGKMIAKKQNIDFARDILVLFLTFDKYEKKDLKAKIEDINKLLSEKLGVVNRGKKIKEIIDELIEEEK